MKSHGGNFFKVQVLIEVKLLMVNIRLVWDIRKSVFSNIVWDEKKFDGNLMSKK